MAGSDALKRDPQVTQQGFPSLTQKIADDQPVHPRDENNVVRV